MTRSPTSRRKQSVLHSASTKFTSSGLHQFLDISPDALLVIDQAGTIISVNEQTAALFGYTRRELPGQQVEILLPERFRSAHMTYREHYFTAPRTREMGAGLQSSGKRKDGSEFPVDISLKPLLIEESPYVIAAVHQMTAQQRMEEKMTKDREDEKQLQMLNLILSAATENVSLFDKNGRIRFVSERTAKQLGLQQRDFPGKTWQEIGLPARFMEPFEEQRRKVMLTGQTCVDEILFTNGAEMRWFEYIAKPVVDEDGEVTSLVASVKEITERKQAEDALHRLSSIVESSGEAIFSKTLEGVITSWNSSAEKLYGYSAEEAIGQPVLLLFPPDHQQEFEEILAQVATGKIVRDHETTRVRKDGTHIPVLVTISPIPDHRGRIIGASTIARDMSEQKRMIRELIEVNAALEEANRVRSQFLSTMSHELRTPLASIIGFGQILMQEAETASFNKAQQNSLERILKNARRLLGLINDVLDLSKIDARRMNVTYSRVDMRKLLTSVVEENQSIAQHLVLRAEVEEGIDGLESDAMKLHQILLNLVSNALKFTAKGEVTLSARRMIASDTREDCIALAVKDSGIGIPVDKQERIFDAFYQVDGGSTRKYGGTGLGLSIVRQLTTLLGGTIAVTSAPGQGSTFTVTLPVKAVQQPVERPSLRLHAAHPEEVLTLSPSSAEPAPARPRESLAVSATVEANDGQNKVVLAVDDNPDIIVLIKAAFKNTPYKVVGLTDPMQLMGLIQEVRPCAITLDVMMPTFNGWQMLHRLKDNPATAAIPVVMLTVLTEPTTGYVLGADDYVIKPFKPEVLVSTLDRMVAFRRNSSQASKRETRL